MPPLHPDLCRTAGSRNLKDVILVRAGGQQYDSFWFPSVKGLSNPFSRLQCPPVPVSGVPGWHTSAGGEAALGVPVQSAHSTHPNPVYTPLLGRDCRPAQLRRQRERSESYSRTALCGPQPTDSPPHLIFLLCWLEANTHPQHVSVALFHCTAWTVTTGRSQSCARQVQTSSRGRICINGVAADWDFWGLCLSKKSHVPLVS